MTVGNDLRALANSIIDSYEMRVKTVGALMNQANQLLGSFQLEIEDMTACLRDNLAKSESLRKKDFDSMMSSVIELCRQTEEEAAGNLKRFQAEEEEMISRLRNIVLSRNRSSLEDIKNYKRGYPETAERAREDHHQSTQTLPDRAGRYQGCPQKSFVKGRNCKDKRFEDYGQLIKCTAKRSRYRDGPHAGRL